MLSSDHSTDRGFTLVEVIVAMTILTVGMLGLGVANGGMIRNAVRLEFEELALQAVEDRLATISLDPRYAEIDSVYGGTETEIDGLTGFTRTTTVIRTQSVGPGGGILDYLDIRVSVVGPGLSEPVGHRTVRGAL
jgi:type II secretion system protein I